MSDLRFKVQRCGYDSIHLFEAPADTKVWMLGRMIARSMNWDIGTDGQLVEYQLEAPQVGRMLDSEETAQSIGLYETIDLILHQIDSCPAADTGAAIREVFGAPPADPVSESTNNMQPVVASISSGESPDPSFPSSSVLLPEAEAASENNNDIEVNPDSPVTTWRKIDLDSPAAAGRDETDPAENNSESGFVWKQLD